MELVRLSRILYRFDLDFFSEYRHGQMLYVGRLWNQGEQVAECKAPTLGELIRSLDSNAQDLIAKERESC